jgi:hypothetical protein
MKNVLLSYFLLLNLFSFSQGKIEFNFNQEDSVVKYFHMVAKGSEFGTYDGYSKYYEDIKVYVYDKKNSFFLSELNKVISQLDSLNGNLKITLTNDIEESNLLIHFKSEQDIRNFDIYYDNYFKNQSNNMSKIVGIANSSFYLKSYSLPIKKIQRSVIWISTENESNMLKHALREEFIQCMGLYNDVNLYKNSIFYNGYNYPTEYSKLDLEIFKMLYTQVN